MSIKIVLKNTLFYALANIIQKGSNFIILFLAAFFLSAKDYGYLALITLFSGLVSMIVTSTIHGSTIRFYIDFEGEERKGFLGSLLIFIISFCLLLVLCISIQGQFLVSALFPNSKLSFYPLFIISLGIVFFAITQPIVNAIFRIKEEPRKIIVISFFSSIIMITSILIFFVVLRQGLQGLLTGQLIASFIIFWFSLYMIRNEFILKFDWRLLRPALFFSLPLLPYIFTDFIRSRSDLFLLEKFVAAGEIGVYYFGVNIGAGMSAVVSTLAASYSPRMFNLLKENPEDIAKEEFKKIFLYIYTLMIFAFVLLSLFSEDVILSLFPKAYHESYRVIPILVLSAFLGGVYLFFHNSFYWTKKTHLVSLNAFIIAVITVSTQIILIPVLGIVGSALGILLGQIIGLIIGYFLSQKVFAMEFNFKKLTSVTVFAILSVIMLSYYFPDHHNALKFAFKILIVIVLTKMAMSNLNLDIRDMWVKYKALLKT